MPLGLRSVEFHDSAAILALLDRGDVMGIVINFQLLANAGFPLERFLVAAHRMMRHDGKG
jgi:hypothetical protein